MSHSCSLTVRSSRYIVFDKKSIPALSTLFVSLALTYRGLVCIVKRVIHLNVSTHVLSDLVTNGHGQSG